MTPWLRNQLATLLQKYQCIGFISHHTPRLTNRDTSKWRPIEWAYAALGNNELTNAPRGILVIDPTAEPHVFRFIAAKRGQRLWTGNNGSTQLIRYFSQSRTRGKILWTESTPTDIEQAENATKAQQDTKKKYSDPELLGYLFKEEGPRTFDQMFAAVGTTGCPISKGAFWSRRKRWVDEKMIVEVGKGQYEVSLDALSKLGIRPGRKVPAVVTDR